MSETPRGGPEGHAPVRSIRTPRVVPVPRSDPWSTDVRLVFFFLTRGLLPRPVRQTSFRTLNSHDFRTVTTTLLVPPRTLGVGVNGKEGPCKRLTENAETERWSMIGVSSRDFSDGTDDKDCRERWEEPREPLTHSPFLESSDPPL